MTDLDELKRLASEATPGQWVKGWNGGLTGTRISPTCYFPDHVQCIPIAKGMGAVALVVSSNGEDDLMGTMDADASFIAAANPAVVLELIEEIEDLRRQLDTMGRY